MEYSADERVLLASLQVAGQINRSSEELELIYAARLYRFWYPPHLRALLDERLLCMEAEIHYILRESGQDLREALARRMMRQVMPPNSSESSFLTEQDRSIALVGSENKSEPPQRSSTPIAVEGPPPAEGEELLEDTQPLHRMQGDSEEKEELEERMMEEMLRKEANEKEEATRKLLERHLLDARRLEDKAVAEGKRYRDEANAMCESAEKRRDVIQDSAFCMMATVMRTVASLRVQAASHFE